MNFSYFCLFLFVARCVAASETSDSSSKKLKITSSDVANSPEALKFVEAMEGKEGNLRTARKVFQSSGNAALRKYCGEQLINLGEVELFELFNSATTVYNKEWILEVILAYGNQGLVDKALKTLKFNDVQLMAAMNSAPVACNTTRFINLVKRFTYEGYQELAVKKGVYALVDANELECFNSLISAPEGEPTLSPELVNIAIRQAFYDVSLYNDERSSFVKLLFDHPAIDEKTYLSALYDSYKYGGSKKELFYQLLVRASFQDLQSVKEDPRFPDVSPEFRNAINDALENVSDETRSEKGKRLRATPEIARDTLDLILPKDLTTMILKYYPE